MVKLAPTRAILWDMDGVLADTGEAHLKAWRVLYKEQGQTLTQGEFAATFGMSNGPIIRRWLGEDTPEERVAAIAARKEALYREIIRGTVQILPGVETWLEDARRRGYRQVVASSTEMANIIAVIGELGIGNFFDALISGACLPASKPDPAIFLQAAAAAGAKPADCIVIEDGTVGVKAAIAGGMRCLAVTTTHPRHELEDADLVVESLAQLSTETMERLFAR